VENATALGIIVVAPAGNGNVNLDQPSCNGLFDRAVRDSGAIIVGAGEAGSNSKTSFSSYGNRVDVQAWGDWSVTTAGYGALYDPLAGDLRRMYTNAFSGTSSASPIVAGAAVAVQGALRASADAPLDSHEMRTLLQQTGTPQVEGAYPGHIGPMPNVPAALASFYNWYAIDVSPQDGVNYIDTLRPADSVSVAVLAGSGADGGLETFAANPLDQSTVRFGPGQAAPIAPITYADVDGDGKSDAQLLFEIGASGIACADTSASLIAETYTGFAVQGADRIATPDCPDAVCHP
jgi:hypothetical protein